MIKILIVEIAPFEINLIKKEFDAGGFSYVDHVLESRKDSSLDSHTFEPDIILLNYIPIKDNLDPFSQQYIDSGIPVICVAGAIGEENAIRLIHEGFADIIFHNNISALIPKINRALLKSKKRVSDQQIAANHRPYHNMPSLDVIFDNCMEGILLTIPDGEILSANPAACKMFGMTEQELIRNGRFGLVDISDPNLEILLEERRTKGKAKGYITLIRKNGEPFPAIISSVVFKNELGQARTSMIIHDISAFKESEQRLKRTQAELEDAIRKMNKTLDESLDIICSFDDQARFVTVSKACESIWGYKAEELIGKVCFDFVFPDDLVITNQTDKNIKDGIAETVFENRYVHKSGHIVHMLWSAKWDENEQLVYCVAKDVSERKKLEKICEVERERFLDLYEQAPCSMGILKGPEYIYEMANPLYLQLIKKGPEIIGQRAKDVLPELESQGIFDTLDQVYNTGKSFIAKERLLQFNIKGDNKLTDMYLNFLYQAHRNAEGEIDGILFFAVDVTEQVLSRLKIEESAKLYRKLISELPVATYSCDAKGRIEIYNKAAAKLWGQEPEIGKDLWTGAWKILTADGIEIPKESCPMAIALKEGHTVSGIELIVERKNGERRNILPHAVPYLSSQNKITGAVTVLTDITESKNAAQNLQQQNIQLLKANNELDRFVYSVSHDLRAPLTSVMGIAKFIEAESAEPDTMAHIRMIIESINRLDGFIRKILNYSKNNRTGLEVEPIAITTKFSSIIDSLKNMLPDVHIDFQVNINEEYPFSSDKFRLNAIIENLVSNAIKYHDPSQDKKFVKIDGRVTKTNLNFSITDNGIGIAKEYHSKIFDMFFRVSGSTEGSGIGLYIVKDMVEKLEGSVELSSSPNCLTVFNVTLKNHFACQE